MTGQPTSENVKRPNPSSSDALRYHHPKKAP